MKLYYSMQQEGTVCDLTIYGEITSWPWLESDVSSYRLASKIAGTDAEKINVYINSYGGETAEGLAIYNALKRHKATVHTYCDGFACSAASVIFMAGDERVMYEASMLMIHNAWNIASGNARQLREEADNLEKISQAAASAYRLSVNIDEETLARLLDEETWISPREALDMGFATRVEGATTSAAPSLNARALVFQALRAAYPALEEPGAKPPPAESTPEQKNLFHFLSAL